MAEQVTVGKKSPEDNEDDKENSSVCRDEMLKEGEDEEGTTTVEVESIPDCPVCLQPCSYPVKLTCGHIFCFLCIKGVVFRSKRCALCRRDVDLSYFENPVVVHFSGKPLREAARDESADTNDKYQWYYEGRNGWWQYEESSSAELEKAHKDSKRSCELLIAGFLYFVDFENMVQFRKTEPGRRRRIKRDVTDAEKKGVAGLRVQSESNRRPVVPPRSEDVPSSAPAGGVRRSCDRPARSDVAADLSEVLPVDRLVVGSSSDDQVPVPRD